MAIATHLTPPPPPPPPVDNVFGNKVLNPALRDVRQMIQIVVSNGIIQIMSSLYVFVVNDKPV